MGKKILYILLGALVVFGLLFLLWKIFFGGSANTPGQTGTLGSAGNATSTIAGGTNNNNAQTPLGTNTNGQISLGGSAGYNAQGVYVGASGAYNAQGTYVGTGGGTAQGGGGTSGGGTSGGGNTLGTGGGTLGTGTTTGLTSVPNVNWLGSPFNPADINSISSGAGGFVPNITSANGGTAGNSLIAALAGTAIAGTLVCGAQAFISGSGLFASGVLGIGGTAGESFLGVPVSDAGTHLVANSTLPAQTGFQAAKANQGFLGCIVNVIGKTALQAITVSVVNWINSGFKGSPSFVTNYQQFFTNVADLATGQFIQGSALSFLCSPFQLQIKIAVAQSYANRNTAQSCSLTKVVGNINNFMNGNFSQGGWGGMVSFTTVPTNNPYGAFAYAQVGLANAQANALANAKNNISPTGFLNLQKVTCGNVTTINTNGSNFGFNAAQASQAAKSGAVCPTGCSCNTTTPGGAIAASLDNTLKQGQDQLGLANDIDQIISALTTQLLTRTLQNGLTSLSQPTTQTPADIAAQSQALSLLNDMQSRTTLAQQLGAIQQGSIGDIESSQAGLNGLANCWGSVASSTTDTSAAQNAAAANATLQSLGDQITALNNSITQINATIATLNQFQSNVSTAGSASDVANVAASYNAAVASGSFPSQTDITTAQQNRTTLQSQLAAINQSTQTGITQCRAAGGQ